MESLVDYSRQAEFDSNMSFRNGTYHYIIGCGGVGFWLGTLLAMQGQESFCLIDGQKIEKSNLNRLPVPPSWIGTNKAVALRKTIRTLRPLTIVQVVTTHVEENTIPFLMKNVGYGRIIVWDCTDDGRIQQKIYKLLKTRGDIKYRKIGYEGFQVGSYNAYDVWLPADYAPGYRTSNACAPTSALAAVLGIVSEGLSVGHDVELNIRDFVRGDTVLSAVEQPQPSILDDDGDNQF